MGNFNFYLRKNCVLHVISQIKDNHLYYSFRFYFRVNFMAIPVESSFFRFGAFAVWPETFWPPNGKNYSVSRMSDR